MTRSFSKSIRLAMIAMTIMLGFSFASPANAQATPPEPCTCFCKTKEDGAVAEKTKMIPSVCSSACNDKKTGKIGVAVCAYSFSEYPSRRLSCFTEDECIGKNYKGLWDAKYKPPECPKSMRYCYPDPAKGKKTKLNVAIGDLEITADIGEYMSQMYRFLLGAGIAIAIVLTMVGGLQYVLAAGSGQVTSAKKRITNSITGLVLLVFAYTILYTINPNLVTLKVPSFPIIKTVILAAENSCEQMIKDGFVIEREDNGQKLRASFKGVVKCGVMGKVISDAAGQQVSEGATCQFVGCPKDKKCLGIGKNAICGACTDVYPDAVEKTGVKPSESVCQGLKKDNVVKAGVTTEWNYCWHSRDLDLLFDNFDKAGYAVGAGTGPLGVALAAKVATNDLQYGICSELKIDCSEITNCKKYEDLKVKTYQLTEDLDDVRSSDWGAGNVNLTTICESDPCGVGKAKPGKAADPCQVGLDAEANDCDHASNW